MSRSVSISVERIMKMSIIKSLSVGNGDLFYIRHNSDSFTIIDCNLPEDRIDAISAELVNAAEGKGIKRFISTHPDEDHIHGIEVVDNLNLCLNFYCVKNSAAKDVETDSFKRYKMLRDHESRAFYISKGCSRRWMNESSEERGSAGIEILWPDVDNACFQQWLHEADNGGKPNNISPIIRYRLQDGATVIWMGDLETDFMEEIIDEVELPRVDILFAPHHGRKSGHVPAKWLKAMNPKVIVVGEAPSEELDYYSGYDTITQNLAGDIEFECVEHKVHVRVSSASYECPYLTDLGLSGSFTANDDCLWYVGSFSTYD